MSGYNTFKFHQIDFIFTNTWLTVFRYMLYIPINTHRFRVLVSLWCGAFTRIPQVIEGDSQQVLIVEGFIRRWHIPILHRGIGYHQYLFDTILSLV